MTPQGYFFTYDAGSGLATIQRSQNGTAITLAATASFAQNYTHSVGGFDSATNSAIIYLYNSVSGASRLVRMAIPASGTAGVVTDLNSNPGLSAGWTQLVWLAAPNAYRVFFYSSTTHNAATVDFVIPTSGDVHAAFQRSSVTVPVAFQGATNAWRAAYKYLALAREASVVSLYKRADGTAAYIYVDDGSGEIFPNSTPGAFGGAATFTRWPSSTGTPSLPGAGFFFPVPLAEPGLTFGRGINASFFALNGLGGGIMQDLLTPAVSINVFTNTSFSAWSHIITLDNGFSVFYLDTTGVTITGRLTRTTPFLIDQTNLTSSTGFELVTPLNNERRTTQIP